jgi:cell wall assembly regulator SMI1
MRSTHDLILAIEAKAQRAGPTLPPPASAAAIAALEAKLGFALPDDVRAFYLAHDGGPDDHESFIAAPGEDYGRELLSIERIAGEWAIWKDLLDKGTFEANDHGKPDPGVQQKWWIPQWVPVTYDGSGNHHIIDVAPAAGGTVGQILSFWHDDAPRTVVASGLLAWLASDDVVFLGRSND